MGGGVHRHGDTPHTAKSDALDIGRTRAERGPPPAPVLCSPRRLEAHELTDVPVRYLDVGTAARVAAGFELKTGEGCFADAPVDLRPKPHERALGAMSKYLAWEIYLLDKVAHDGICRFGVFCLSIVEDGY
jgi:hypothetical protein